MLTASLERPVEVHRVQTSDWVESARASGLREYPVDALVRMFDYYDRHGLRGNPRVLSGLLGRSPTTFGEFVARTLQAG